MSGSGAAHERCLDNADALLRGCESVALRPLAEEDGREVAFAWGASFGV